MSSLLDFYAKCRKIAAPAQFIREIPNRNSLTFRAMMSGFIQNGYIKDAINLFRQMQAANFEPRAEILRSIFDACTHLETLQLGKELNLQIYGRNYAPGNLHLKHASKMRKHFIG